MKRQYENMPSFKVKSDFQFPYFRAVIFDWDGVLARTMEANFEAWTAALNPYGIKLDRQEYFLLEGMPTRNVAQYFLKKNGCDSSLADEIKGKKEAYFQSKSHLEFYPFAQECMASLLSQNVDLALVTGASRRRLDGSGALPHLAKFKTVITADEVTHGKPNPEPYFRAIQGLGMEAESCLVVENAPLGITAAKQAGLRVAALATTLEERFLQEADWVIPNMEIFLKTIQKNFQQPLQQNWGHGL